jgi:hypothetical protein
VLPNPMMLIFPFTTSPVIAGIVSMKKPTCLTFLFSFDYGTKKLT